MKKEKVVFLDRMNERLQEIESKLRELEQRHEQEGGQEQAEKISKLRESKQELVKRMREVLDAPEAESMHIRDRLEADLEDLDKSLSVALADFFSRS